MRLVGIYDADGGALGELRYVLGKLRGTSSCALCDITHGARVRVKPAWKDVTCELPVPVDLVHRDEAGDVPASVRDPLPCVVAETDDGWVRVLDPAALGACGGDPRRFRDALLAAARERGLL